MKRILIALLLYSVTNHAQSLKITGGLQVNRENINADVLREVIQQKQEEVFTRLFQNVVVNYFQNKNPTEGLYNFPTYYALHNIVSDLTIGKSKTTVSKSVINSMSELAFIYAFVQFYQEYEVSTLPGATALTARNDVIGQSQIVIAIYKHRVLKDDNKLLTLNYYLEAAFDVLANDATVQNQFFFSRPITSPEIKIWYDHLGLVNQPYYNTLQFRDITGALTTLPSLRANMQAQVNAFLQYSGSNNLVRIVSHLQKSALGLPALNKNQIDQIKLALFNYAAQTDLLFDRNVVKNLLGLLIENTHVDTDPTVAEIYIDVESLILSLSNEFIPKQKRSSISSVVFFINPRPFFTIGTSTIMFPNENELDNIDGKPATLRMVNVASEKIGLRFKLWDGGYSHSFQPGEVYKQHGRNYVWNQPQTRPLISSIYYNAYASGILYNALNLKTNSNFNYGFVGSNIGLQFFNGLELSSGIACVYKDGLNSDNIFLKVDFDVPIIDYLTALTKKNKDK